MNTPSAHTSHDLPPTVLGWVETILARKQNSPTALVALFDRDATAPLDSLNSIYAHLHDAARRAKLDCLFSVEWIRT